MKKLLGVLACSLLIMGSGQALADDDFYAIVESRPEGKVGVWVLGGRSLDVTEKTRLDEDDGPLAVGTCAEVELRGGMVKEIESEPAGKCADFYGIIESRPETVVGTWVVGGRSLDVTEKTRLDEDDGPLAVGACAEVELRKGAVQEIESEPAHKCGR